MAISAVGREAVFALRRQIAKIEGTLADRLEEPADPANPSSAADGWVVRRQGRPSVASLFPTGSKTLDGALGGGLPCAALTEIHGAETRDSGIVSGFALGLAAQGGFVADSRKPLLWVATGEILAEAGLPYAPALATTYGIAPEAMLLATAPRLQDALWIAEEASSLASLALVLLEVRGGGRQLDLTATRRLHRRAQASGRPVLLLRQAGRPEPTAAPVRLVVAPAPARERTLLSGALAGSIGPPAVTVSITRSRMARPAAVTLEWNDDEHRFRERQPAAHGTEDPGDMVSAPAERPDPAPPPRPGVESPAAGNDVAA